VPIRVYGTHRGDLPVVGVATLDLGHAVMFFTDFADFSRACGRAPEVEQLLIGATPGGSQPVPEPGALALLAGAGVGGSLLMVRRRR